MRSQLLSFLAPLWLCIEFFPIFLVTEKVCLSPMDEESFIAIFFVKSAQSHFDL